MGMITIFERGDDVKRFDEAVKRAKSGLSELCEIWEDMKAQFSERRGSYSSRYSSRDDDGYGERHWDDMSERRYRHY